MTQTALPLRILGSAMFSDDGRYRYALERPLPASEGEPAARLLFVMLNPSTADEDRDDPTVRRCIGFARRWGYTRLSIANLYGWRATKPENLFCAVDPIGKLNDSVLRGLADEADLIVCAWGVHGAKYGRGRKVLEMLRAANGGEPVYCLGKTAAGEPRHPLYVRGDVDPIPYA